MDNCKIKRKLRLEETTMKEADEETLYLWKGHWHTSCLSVCGVKSGPMTTELN